jgi:MYXO-CTERM domain-containing protein
MLGRVRGILVAAGFVCGWLPDDARACVFRAEVSSIVPSAEEHPANAAVVLFGSGLRPDALTATVDGHAVDIVVDEGLAMPGFGSDWSILPLRFEPSPSPGQTVSVTGTACDPAGPPTCEVAITYVAGDADVAIAEPIPTLAVDLVRRSTADWGDSCGPGGSRVIARVEVDDTMFADEALVLCEVVARHDAAGLQEVSRRRMPASKFDQTVFFSGIVGQGFPLDGWCVDVRMIDAAGNAGTVASSCDACMYYEGDLEAPLDALPFEPIPGGACDRGGCACASTRGDGPGGWWLLALFVTWSGRSGRRAVGSQTV